MSKKDNNQVPIAHRVYWVKGFIMSGWFFFMPGCIKLHDGSEIKYSEQQIKDSEVKLVYICLEIRRKLINLFRKVKK